MQEKLTALFAEHGLTADFQFENPDLEHFNARLEPGTSLEQQQNFLLQRCFEGLFVHFLKFRISDPVVFQQYFGISSSFSRLPTGLLDFLSVEFLSYNNKFMLAFTSDDLELYLSDTDFRTVCKFFSPKLHMKKSFVAPTETDHNELKGAISSYLMKISYEIGKKNTEDLQRKAFDIVLEERQATLANISFTMKKDS